MTRKLDIPLLATITYGKDRPKSSPHKFKAGDKVVTTEKVPTTIRQIDIEPGTPGVVREVAGNSLSAWYEVKFMVLGLPFGVECSEGALTRP